ncbi:hypothetical protein BKA82DRAFT_2321007 [Pisolithus tinctorius]|nr:hypothetical protein BKA82DRAFT_2321007 [Pisolithus tinctorius]
MSPAMILHTLFDFLTHDVSPYFITIYSFPACLSFPPMLTFHYRVCLLSSTLSSIMASLSGLRWLIISYCFANARNYSESSVITCLPCTKLIFLFYSFAPHMSH